MGQPLGCVASLGDLAVKGGWTECTPHEGARDRMSAAIDERAGNQGAEGTGSCAIHIRNTPQTLSSMRDHHLESQLRAGPLVRAIKADMVSRIRARLRSQSFGPSPCAGQMIAACRGANLADRPEGRRGGQTVAQSDLAPSCWSPLQDPGKSSAYYLKGYL